MLYNSKMLDIKAKLEAVDYNIDDSQLEEMLTLKQVAGVVDTEFADSYFRVLVRRYQKVVGVLALSDEKKYKLLNSVAKPMKDLVNKVYITPDIAADPNDPPEVKAEKTAKRQSLTKFADTAKAELKAAIGLGTYDKLGVSASKSAYVAANREARKEINNKVDPVDKLCAKAREAVMDLVAAHKDASYPEYEIAMLDIINLIEASTGRPKVRVAS